MPRIQNCLRTFAALLAGLSCSLISCGEKPAIRSGKEQVTQAGKSDERSAAAREAIGELAREKAARTPAQKKLDSQIVLALKKSRKEPPFDKPTTFEPGLTVAPDGRVLADLDAMVSSELLELIERTGGKVINSFEASHAIRALIPLTQMEALAGRDDVRFIAPAAQAMTNQTNSLSESQVEELKNQSKANPKSP